MEDAFVPTMKILFDAPVTSPLAEIDVEDVGMFFVHLTREDMLQTFDKEKQSKNILESSTTSIHDSLAISVCNQVLSCPDGYQTKVLIKILTNLVLTHNNFVHIRELKVLSESLLSTIKERSVIRSVEKFDKQLAEWLAKAPAKDVEKDKEEEGDQSKKPSISDEDDRQTDGSMTPTRSRKRILFSQTLSNTLLDPDQLPSKISRTSSSSVYRSPTNKVLPSTDDDEDDETFEELTLTEKTQERTTVEESDEEEGEAVVTKKTTPSKKGKVLKHDEKGSQAQTEEDSSSELPSSQAVSIEILPASSEEDSADNDDLADLFSEPSSTGSMSVNVSKLPRGSIADTSTDSDASEAQVVTKKKPSPRSSRGSKIPKPSTSKDPATPTRSSRRGGSAVSSPAPSSSVRSSSRSSKLPTPVSTPTSTRKRTKQTASAKETQATPTKTKAKAGSKAPSKTVLEVSSPRTMSRAGRNNSPRIDYKTGKKIEEPVRDDSNENVQKAKTKTDAGVKKVDSKSKIEESSRKRGKVKTPDSSRSSATSSPVPKKNLVAEDSSGSDFVENTPPTSRTRRYALHDNITSW